MFWNLFRSLTKQVLESVLEPVLEPFLDFEGSKGRLQLLERQTSIVPRTDFHYSSGRHRLVDGADCSQQLAVLKVVFADPRFVEAAMFVTMQLSHDLISTMFKKVNKNNAEASETALFECVKHVYFRFTLQRYRIRSWMLFCCRAAQNIDTKKPKKRRIM